MAVDRIDSRPRGLGAPTGPDHQTVTRYVAQPGVDIVVRNGLGEETRRPTTLHIIAKPGEIDLRRARLIPLFDVKAKITTDPQRE